MLLCRFLSFALFVVSVGFASEVGAAHQSCTDVRVSAIDSVAVPNQGNLNTCYAHVAAQMTDVWRLTHVDSHSAHRTSAIAAALATSIHERLNTIDTGRACEVIDELRRTGSCNESAVAPQFKSPRMHQIIVHLRAYYDNFHRFRDPKLELALIEELDHFLRVDLKIQDIFVPSQSDLRKILTESKSIHFLNGLMARGCVQSQVVQVSQLPACREFRRQGHDGSFFLNTISSRLDRNNPQPVAISLCAQVLKKGYTAGVLVHQGEPESSCAKHVVLVFGRRWTGDEKSGKCQYLIRNSWGTRPGRYALEWQTDESQNVWVDSEALIGNTYGVAYLE